MISTQDRVTIINTADGRFGETGTVIEVIEKGLFIGMLRVQFDDDNATSVYLNSSVLVEK